MWCGIVRYHSRWGDHINSVTDEIVITVPFDRKGDATKHARAIAKKMCEGRRKAKKGHTVKAGEVSVRVWSVREKDAKNLGGAPYYPTITDERETDVSF